MKGGWKEKKTSHIKNGGSEREIEGKRERATERERDRAREREREIGRERERERAQAAEGEKGERERVTNKGKQSIERECLQDLALVEMKKESLQGD